MNNDLISREALKEKFERLVDETIPYGGVAVNDMRELINNAPTVDLTENQAYDKGFITAMKLYARPQGEWIEIDIKPLPFGAYTCKRKCNKCNYVTSEYRPNFCPNCGAKKKGGAEND